MGGSVNSIAALYAGCRASVVSQACQCRSTVSVDVGQVQVEINMLGQAVQDSLSGQTNSNIIP